ncbi:MAG TPA: hypothetical protein VNW92_24425 [Polyangiaceae bacterium]|jgi:hypothetical protein|nr:hypothetical protein [Polyangiaceae bacterium]
MNQDQEHLRLLSIFHYVMAGFACLLPLFSLIYIGMGIMMVSGKMPSSSPTAAHGDMIGGWIFIGVGGIFFLVGVVGAILNFLAGRSLAKHERRTLCLVVAGLNCMHMPLGTLLGVFTFIVLGRPSVKALFSGAADGAWQGSGAAYPPGTSPFSNPNR